MGLFSAKKKIEVSLGYSSIVKNKHLPNTVVSSLVGDIIGHRRVTSSLLHDIVNGPPGNLQRFYKYAAKGKYPPGLPRVNFKSAFEMRTAVHSYLTSEYGLGTRVHYGECDEINMLHRVMGFLIDTYQYDPIANASLTKVPGKRAYIHSIVVYDDPPNEADAPDEVIDPPSEEEDYSDDTSMGDPVEFVDSSEDDSPWFMSGWRRLHPWRDDFPIPSGSRVDYAYTDGTVDPYIEIQWAVESDLATGTKTSSYILNSLPTAELDQIQTSGHGKDMTYDDLITTAQFDLDNGYLTSGGGGWVRHNYAAAQTATGALIGVKKLSISDDDSEYDLDVADVLNGARVQYLSGGSWVIAGTIDTSGVGANGEYIKVDFSAPVSATSWRIQRATGKIALCSFHLLGTETVQDVGEIVTEEIPHIIGSVGVNDLVVQALFTKPNGELGFLSYGGGVPRIPVLDLIIEFTDGDTSFEMMPMIPIRSLGRNLSQKSGWGGNAATFKKYKRGVDLLGLDLVHLGKSVHKNENVGNTLLATIIFGFEADTTSQWGKKYIYAFMDTLYGMGYGRKKQVSMKITDAVSNMSFQFDRITDKGIKNGKVSPNAEIGDVVIQSAVEIPNLYVIAKKQITDTTYHQYNMRNPLTITKIGAYNAWGSPLDWKSNNATVVFPVSRRILKENFKFKDQEKVYFASLGMYTFSFYEIVTKWYQSSWFSVVMNIISAVLLYVGIGAAVQAAYQAAGAALSLVAVGQIALAIIKELVFKFIIGFMAKAIINLLPPEFGMALAIIGIAFGAGKMMGIELTGTLATVTSGIQQIAGHASQAAQQSINEKISETQSDFKSEMEFLKRETEEFEDQMKAMVGDEPPVISQAMALQLYTNMFPGDTPTTFYDRLIHTPDKDLLVYDYMHMMYDLSVRLPEPGTV